MKVQVAIDNDHFFRRIFFKFEVDELAFREWKDRHYGNTAIGLNAIDPVGEAIHLLREFYLDQAGSSRPVEKAKVEVVDPPGRALSPASPATLEAKP